MKNGVLACAALIAFTALAQQQPAWPVIELPTVNARLQDAPLTQQEKVRVAQAIASRDYASAEKSVLQAIDANPKSTELLKLAAAIFMLDRNPANTAIALKKAEKIAPLTVSDRFLLSMAYISIGKRQWARPELQRLAAEENGNPLFPYWLSRLDYDDRRYEDAVARLQAITRDHPDFIRAWDNLGLSLEALGRLDEAVECYQTAVKLNREQRTPSPWPPLNLGTLLTKLAREKEAVEYLRAAVAYEDTLAEAHYRLGMALHKSLNDDEAVRELERAAELNPSDPQPFYTLGRIYQSRGNESAAASAFAKFEKLRKTKRGS